MHERLTDAQLEDVCWRAQRTDWIDAVVTAWRLIEPRFDSLDEVVPWRYSLPEGQWLAIAEALKRGPGGLSAALTWMNVGPSGSRGACILDGENPDDCTTHDHEDEQAELEPPDEPVDVEVKGDRL
jgi:hypothetical protein